MAVTTILVEDDKDMLGAWTDYIKQYDQEICKTAAQDISGLGTPQVASTKTLEEVLDLMGKAAAGGIVVIYAHANANGLLMRITANSQSAMAKNIRGVSRAWKAIFEVIKLRSGEWPAPGKSGKPVFRIDVPAAQELFKRLVQDLGKFDGGFEKRLPDPNTVTNRDQADAWIDQWVEMMAKASLAPGLTQDDLRRVCRAMQKVRDLRFERVEIRACNIGKDKENLNAFKEFFGAGKVTAPKTTMFFGKAPVNLNPGADLDQLAKQMGGFRGTVFTAPGAPGIKQNNVPGGEAEVATGKRNRIFPSQKPGQALLQVTELVANRFHFKSKAFAATAAEMTKFVQANYKGSASFAASSGGLPVGGMWTPGDPATTLPFLLPLEPTYRDFIETSS